MVSKSKFAVFLLFVAVLTTDPTKGADTPRWLAVFGDGSMKRGNRMDHWDHPAAQTSIDGHSLHGDNFARFVLDTTKTIEVKPPFVVMANGDVLPGEIVGFRPSRVVEGAGGVLLQLRGPLRSWEGQSLTVRPSLITRFVRKSSPARGTLPPGRVQLRDGQVISAQRFRFSASGLQVLTSSGVQKLSLGAIAEFCTPADNQIDVLMEAAAHAWRAPKTRVIRLVAEDGTIVTHRSDIGKKSYVDRNSKRIYDDYQSGCDVYLHVVPAWSFGPVLVPQKYLAARSIRSPLEIPVPLLPATYSNPRSGLAGRAMSAYNQGPRAPFLTVGELTDISGFSVHGDSEISVQLPVGAKTFSTWAGLDPAVGSGGCVHCQMFVDFASTPVFKRDFVLGGQQPLRIGPIDVIGAKTIRLVTDMAHKGRPAGADPLDIRDNFNWLRPTVTIDPDLLATHDSILNRFDGAAEWSIEQESLGKVEVHGSWNKITRMWDPQLRLKEDPFSMRVEKTIAANNDILELRLAEIGDKTLHGVEVTVNGESLAPRSEILPVLDEKTRERYDPQTRVYWWDLKSYRGQSVSVALRFFVREGRRDFAWRGLRLTSAMGTTKPQFESIEPGIRLTELEGFDLQSHKGRGHPVAGYLPATEIENDPLRLRGQVFTDGIGMMHDSEISFHVKPEYERFVTLVGCAAQTAGPLTVSFDGEPAWTREAITVAESAEQVDLPIPPGTKKLTLKVGPVGSYDGRSAWVNPGFISKEAASE